MTPNPAIGRQAAIAAMGGPDYVRRIDDLRSLPAVGRRILLNYRVIRAYMRGQRDFESAIDDLIMFSVAGDSAALKALKYFLPRLPFQPELKQRVDACVTTLKSKGGRPPNDHVDQMIVIGIAAAIREGNLAATQGYKKSLTGEVVSACALVASLLPRCNLTGEALEPVWERWKDHVLWNKDDFQMAEARARRLFGDS